MLKMIFVINQLCQSMSCSVNVIEPPLCSYFQLFNGANMTYRNL